MLSANVALPDLPRSLAPCDFTEDDAFSDTVCCCLDSMAMIQPPPLMTAGCASDARTRRQRMKSRAGSCGASESSSGAGETEDENSGISPSKHIEWMRGLIARIHMWFSKKKKSPPKLSPQVLSVLVRLARAVLHFDSDLRQRAWSQVFQPLASTGIEPEWSADDVIAVESLRAAILLETVAETGWNETASAVSIKELHSHREALRPLLLHALVGETFLRKAIKMYLSAPMYHAAAGKRFLCWMLGTIDVCVVERCAKTFEALVGAATEGMKAATSSVMFSQFSEVLLGAWKLGGDPGITAALENLVENWTFSAVKARHTQRARYLGLLQAFHTNHEAPVAEMLFRILPGKLFEYLHSPNCYVRANAVTIFCLTFPLLDASLPTREYELELEKNISTLEGFVMDSNPHVRVAAIQGWANLLAGYWELLPFEVAARMLTVLVEKLVRDAASTDVRVAAISAIKKILMNPLAQEPLRPVVKLLGPCLHDTQADVRNAMAQLLVVISHVPGYSVDSICEVKEICTRLILESIIVEAERATRGKSNGSITTSEATCEFLAVLVSSLSIYPKTGDMTIQLDEVMAAAKDHPGILSPLIVHSSHRAPALTRFRLAAALYRYSWRQLTDDNYDQHGSSTNPRLESNSSGDFIIGPSNTKNCCLAASLITSAAEVLGSLTFHRAGAKRKGKTKQQAKEDAIELDKEATVLISNFPLDLAMPFISEGCFEFAPVNNRDIIGKACLKLVDVLLAVPGYKAPDIVASRVSNLLRKCDTVGSESWCGLVQLTDRLSSSSLESYLTEACDTLKMAHENILMDMSRDGIDEAQSEAMLDASDIKITSLFIRALPRIIKQPHISETTRQRLVALSDEFLESLVKCGNDLSATCVSQCLMRYWAEGVKSAAAVLILDQRGTTVYDRLLKVAEQLRPATYPPANETLAGLLAMGATILGDTGAGDQQSGVLQRYLFRCLSESLAVAALLVPRKKEEAGDVDLSQSGSVTELPSLFGIRNLILLWMYTLVTVSYQEFDEVYLVAWDELERLLRALMSCPRVSLHEFFATLALFMCMALIGQSRVGSGWRIRPDGQIWVYHDNGHDETTPLQPGKKRKRRSENSDDGQSADSIAEPLRRYPSILVLPRSVSNGLHPRLHSLMVLIRSTMKSAIVTNYPRIVSKVAERNCDENSIHKSGGILNATDNGNSGTSAALAYLTEVAMLFGGDRFTPGIEDADGFRDTLPAQWVPHIPDSTRAWFFEICRAVVTKYDINGQYAQQLVIPSGPVELDQHQLGHRFCSVLPHTAAAQSAEAMQALQEATGRTPLREPGVGAPMSARSQAVFI